jgi:glutathione S-transferase
MIELLQFRHSPYNEKVRWALDLKRVPHARRSLLPGPHVPIVKRLTGQTATPVLVSDDGQAIDGSARIVEWLEQRFPAPALMPGDDAARAEVARIQKRFDDDLTPRMRRAVLDALLRQPTYFAHVFGDGRPAWKRAAYSLAVPLAAPLVRKGNGISGPQSVADGIAAANEALSFVAERSRATGYLVGASFGLADLVAASSLAMIVRPADSPMSCPQPVGSEFERLIAPFRDHPGAAWVRTIYAKHRLARADFDGPSDAAASAPSTPNR